jgi:hypothetical protein
MQPSEKKQYSEKELRKYALRLTTVGRRNRLRTLIVFLLGIFCIAYLVSSGRSFIENEKALREIEVSRLRIEVLNGTDISGLAKEASEFLRDKGFDVVRYGNTSKKVEKTVVIDRTDPESKNARLVRDVLKQGTITYEPHSVQLLEVTVVMGKDFEPRKEASIIKE